MKIRQDLVDKKRFLANETHENIGELRTRPSPGNPKPQSLGLYLRLKSQLA